MDIKKAVEDLQKCDSELKTLNRLKRLRRVLRFILIGFLISKDADKRISELMVKRSLIIRSIEERLEEIETAHRQIKEISKSGTLLNEVQQKQWMLILGSLSQDFAVLRENSALIKESTSTLLGALEKYQRILSDCAQELLTQRKEAIRREVSRVKDSGTYLVYDEKERLLSCLKSFEEELTSYESKGLLDDKFTSSGKQELENHRKFLSAYNATFIDRRKREYDHLFNKAKLSLDEEQKNAIVTDDKHNLVVAAAGSGKTEVLITRVAYLIERKPDGAKPNRILAIAFQDKAKGEIEQRLRDRYNITDVNVRTFHKLGKDILEANRGQRFGHTNIIDENKKTEMIREIYESKLKNEKGYYQLFLGYVRTFYDRQREFQDKDDILGQKEISSNVSINNTLVKSRPEKEIMDFFLMHKLNGEKVKIEYEPDVAEFRPDFRLTKYDSYIEHWGINEKGEVADWFGQSTEEYRQNMERKRAWFHDNDKLLVETFAYEYDEKEREKFVELLKERVLAKLQKKFDSKFEFTAMTYEEVVEVAWAPYKDSTPNDIANFIKNAKTYGLIPDRIEEKLRNGKWSSKQLAFGRLALEVYRNYEQELQKHNKIDFEDMINKAIDALLKDKGLYSDHYDHILIDEYQDISAQRNRLIQVLLERNPTSKLFCVGDDWQIDRSIDKSKGLQAKVVFILNVVKDLYGFPCEIEDSSIYEPARENYPKQDQKQEERRLFYVAMTRAMEELVIYTWEPSKSEFLEEIKEHIDEEPLYY